MDSGKSQNGRMLQLRDRLASARDVFEQFRLMRLLLVAGLALVIALAMSPNLISRIPRYEIGDFAIGNLRAPYELSVVDDEATVEGKKKALEAVPHIYRYDPQVLFRASERLNDGFRKMNGLFKARDEIETKKLRAKEKAEKLAVADAELKNKLVKNRASIQSRFGLELTDDEYELLIRKKFDPKLGMTISNALEMVYSRYVTYDHDEVLRILTASPGEGTGSRIKVQIQGQDKEEKITQADQIISPKEAESALLELTANLWQSMPKAERQLMQKITLTQIKPNLIFEREATELARQRAVNAVLPVTYSFKKNQLIIGDGQEVTRQPLVVLNHLRERAAPRGWAQTLLGSALLAFVTILLAFWLTDINIPRFVITDRDMIMLGILLVSTLLTLRFADWFGDQLLDQFPGTPRYFMLFLFPLAAPAMLVRFLTRFEVAFVFAVVLITFSILVIQAPLHYFALALIISLVGAHTMRRVKRRGQILRAGLWVSLAGITAALIVAVLVHDFSWASLVYTPLAGLAGGLLAGILVLGLAPLFEYAFGYTTDISLLELANYENPLLKRIQQYAPGTFHHSIAISSLGEAAVEAIGGNALLVRVGAMYHDVGKSLNPHYFVENQTGGNPHDKVNDPAESARIVRAHIIDGAKYARENGLPEQVVDFILQHHGTRTISYFLAQAKKQAAEREEKVNENDFRYPGPKPQTCETAILMICDVVEARSRTLDDRSEDAVMSMIGEMIRQIGEEGQFDECPITTRDLKISALAIAQVILGMNHKRIPYPDQVRIRRHPA